ncbi:hypothetical protein ACIQTM_37675, partial [Streptomyces erythrochromogenes]
SQFMDPKGNIYDADGAITQHAKDAPTGKPDAGADVPRTDAPKADFPATVRVPEHELVGVGVRGGDGSIRLGSDISDPVHHTDHRPGTRPDTSPGGNAHDHARSPSASHEPPSATGRTDSPSTGGSHADTTPGGDGHPDGHAGTGQADGRGTGGHHEPASTGGPGDGGAPSGAGDEGLPPGRDSGSDTEATPPDQPGVETVPPEHFASDGAPYVDEPQGNAGAAYDAIRANEGDTIRIAENTGISREVLDGVRQHLFFTVHERFPIGPGQVRNGRVAPMEHVADLWQRAEAGTLDEAGQVAFRRLMVHEGVEGVLMAEGMPYRGMNYDADGVNWFTREHYGAHEVSPHETHANPYVAWRSLGMDPPSFEIRSDLSNLDDLIEYIRRNKP